MPSRRPNIVLITDDQHRWDYYDNAHVPTLRVPNLDRLRAEGTTLTHAFAVSPICCPNRFAWTHALYPTQAAAGMAENWHPWPRDLDSMPRSLREAGYHTALIGKLHAQARWGDDLTDEKFVREAQHRGYDHVMEVCGKSLAKWDDCHWTHHLRSKGLLDRYREDLSRRVEMCGGDEPSDASFLSAEDSMDGFIGGHATAWLDAVEPDRPFFLHASYCGPHFPIDPPAAYHTHTPDEIPDPVGCDDPERIAMWKRRAAAYCGMIEQIDDEVGKLLAILDLRGLADNTLVIFGTDHGDMMGHLDAGHKGPPHDTSTRTPYILRWPGKVPADHVLEGMVESVDLPISIMDAAGIDEPENQVRQTPGRSFMPYVLGDAPPPRQWVFSHVGAGVGFSRAGTYVHDEQTRERLYAEDHSQGWRMVRDQRFKYIYYPHQDDALFDIEADPWETTNILGEPEHAERVSRMRSWLIESTRHLVAPNRFAMNEHTYDDAGNYLG